MVLRVLALILMLAPTAGVANDRLVRLSAPDTLVDTGLLRFILPRFTLKTQVRIEFVGPDDADLVLGEAGRAVFQGPEQVWKLDIRSPNHPGTARLVDWMRSDVGQRTIASYQPDGAPLFGAPEAQAAEAVEITMDGDAEYGHRVSREKCTRCHGVDAATSGWGIGSTPSFAVLRTFPDWEQRFAAFYVLNPHPAFTQIIEVTAPFPIDRPSPIAPVEMTLEELEAVLAYVATMQAADLGSPIQHQ